MTTNAARRRTPADRQKCVITHSYWPATQLPDRPPTTHTKSD